MKKLKRQKLSKEKEETYVRVIMPNQKEETYVRVIMPHKKEGWFCFTEFEIPLSVLESKSKVVSVSDPDVFAIFKDQVTCRLRSIFGI